MEILVNVHRVHLGLDRLEYHRLLIRFPLSAHRAISSWWLTGFYSVCYIAAGSFIQFPLALFFTQRRNKFFRWGYWHVIFLSVLDSGWHLIWKAVDAHFEMAFVIVRWFGHSISHNKLNLFFHKGMHGEKLVLGLSDTAPLFNHLKIGLARYSFGTLTFFLLRT